MKAIETPRFQFLTFDQTNKEHLEALCLMQEDPLFNDFFPDIKNYFSSFSFEPEDLGGQYLTFLNGQIVGFVTLFDELKYGTIDYGVLPRFRSVKIDQNSTIACSMTKEFAEEIFKKRKVTEYLKAYIDAHNVRSIEMAKKVGFTLHQYNIHIPHDEYRKYR